jgi:hypothetical protein
MNDENRLYDLKSINKELDLYEYYKKYFKDGFFLDVFEYENYEKRIYLKLKNDNPNINLNIHENDFKESVIKEINRVLLINSNISFDYNSIVIIKIIIFYDYILDKNSALNNEIIKIYELYKSLIGINKFVANNHEIALNILNWNINIFNQENINSNVSITKITHDMLANNILQNKLLPFYNTK